uniref:protein-tyrosine-phosphatase n=1 Tax=Neobodo designis TaxID=312471 RepID=A0A7S1M4Q8_NEODS|mmetsp:Transcript_34052/g.105156  ORF Transcript_34052/g.105156 Transcript_34052/m.105156 type:complete len:583 (+) Transcript_34052:123-1871(+)|eukprot:CAMPEP_0174850982 /NCGR_PEP_ID=MMETSP1114-20130205/21241_1 /TAXON_ID=312471 /ORGANISM="Neobodo designis, Strain CCAP 1951/1" /LENGTH=582 /DNA_ID=CAMNT_0016085479 /DNA_START=123 /DNA_END=1871 /DNA_ORIENTATION=-
MGDSSGVDTDVETGGAIHNLGISISSASDVPHGLRLSINASSQSGATSHSQSRLFASSAALGHSRASVAALGGFIQPGMGGIGVVVPDSVYFCGEREVNHLPNVQMRRISAFLAVAKEVNVPTFVQQSDLDSGAARFAQLDMSDDHNTVLRKHFARAFRFLDRCRAEGHRVMIYCRQGQSRSASIAAAYVMRNRKCGFMEALDHLRQTRKADPNFLFCQQLDAFARDGCATSMSSSVAATPLVPHHAAQAAAASNPTGRQSVSSASVATGATDSTPKSGTNAPHGLLPPEASTPKNTSGHSNRTGAASRSPETVSRTTSGVSNGGGARSPRHGRPLPSFLAGNMFSVSMSEPGIVSFHSMDPADPSGVHLTAANLNRSATSHNTLLPHMVRSSGSHPSGAGFSRSAEADQSGPLGVPDADPNDVSTGGVSTGKPPTVASTAPGTFNLSRMMDASVMTNPGAMQDAPDDGDDDLIPKNDSHEASVATHPFFGDPRRGSTHTQAPLPSPGLAAPEVVESSLERNPIALPMPAGDNSVATRNPLLDDEPDYGRARDLLADSGVIGDDGLLVDVDVGYDGSDEGEC